MYQNQPTMGMGMNYNCANYNPYPYSQNYNNYNNYSNSYSQAQQLLSQAPQLGNQFMKMVDSIEVVKATDIPMDGNYYYFPKADGSNIFAKKWLPNGTTHILTYKPVIEGNTENDTYNDEKTILGANSELTKAFMDRFDRIEKLLAPFSDDKEAKNE